MTEKIVGSFVTHLIQPVITLMFIVAILIFIWGVVEMIMNGGNDEARAKGSKHVMWGLIGLFIMFGVYGILNILADVLKG